MNESNTPSGWAASTKVVLDAVRGVFGVAVLALTFSGATLVALACGWRDLDPKDCWFLMVGILLFMFLILVGLVLLRIFKPIGLAGPPQPETRDVTFENSKDVADETQSGPS